LAKRLDDNNNDDFFRTIESQKSSSSSTHKQHFMTRRNTIASLVASMAVVSLEISSSPAAWADEYGREIEAPMDLTGEGVMICTKRGPLGACLKTEKRTKENDNDKALNYFATERPNLVKGINDYKLEETTEGEGSLIGRLKKQSEDNFEKNELLVKQRTAINDSPASFGPFDNQVLILNEDGKEFTLLANPQAMRLKKLGLIENKKFTRQPTQEELEAALPPPKKPNMFTRFLGNFQFIEF